jgi:hypothetical protein
MGKKSGGSPPPAPDPVKTAEAQAAANKEAILTSAMVNRIGEVTPYGETRWEIDPGGPAAEQQAAYQQQLADWQKQVDAINTYNAALPAATTVSQGSYYDTDMGEWTQAPGGPSTAQSTVQRKELPSRPERPELDEGWRRVSELTPEGQAQLGQQQELASMLGSSAIGRAGQISQDPFALPGARPELQDVSDVEQRQFQRAMELMNPELERQERRMQTNLSQRGIPIGGEAYSDVQGQFDKSRDEMLRGAAFDAMRAGQAEQGRRYGLERGAYQDTLSDTLLERQQPMNELAAILQGSPALQVPQFGPQAQYQVAPADIMGATQANYQGGLSRWQQEQQNAAQSQAGTQQLIGTGLMAMAMMCHPSFKENKRPISEILPRMKELKIEAWDYKEGIADGKTHIGPYSDQFNELFGVGDGVTIPFIDAVGVCMLSIKELLERVEYLEAENA